MNRVGDAKGYEAYNARWLTASQVAATFVAPPQFQQLSAHGHAILVGPRGSGKTTLLKMLQQPALERWTAEEAAEFRERIGYTGVFIPADVSWGQQLSALGGDELDGDARGLLSLAAFSSHILHALVEAMIFRVSPVLTDIVEPFRRVVLEKQAERELVVAIAEYMHVKPAISTLLSLKHALAARMGEIYSIAKREQFRIRQHAIGEGTLCDNAFLYLDPLAVANACVEAFDDIASDADGKWALLFDELEIAPDSIQQRLIDATRSTYPKLLFKLALSPYNIHGISKGGTSAPSPDNDYDQIALWYPYRDQKGASQGKRRFCNNLWYSMLVQKGFPPTAPEVALGGSYSENDDPTKEPGGRAFKGKKTSSPYARDGRWGSRFVRLYEGDPTFRQFLDERRISPHSLETLPEPIRDSVVRKVAPIVAIREFYRRPVGPDDRRPNVGRSRKGIEIFTGAESLFEISEGHPRWFKVTVGRLLDQARDADKLTISRSVQGQEILAWAQRFSALLKTYPAGAGSSKRGSTLLSLVETIARFFHSQVVKAPFSSEPYLSFTVDSHLDSELLQSLQHALNLGAIVYVPDDAGQAILTSLRGKRFRISHWLAPLYGLPLTVGRSVALSSILHETPKQVSATRQLPFNDDMD